MIVTTVADLIRELSKLPANTVPISLEPPFTGVKIVQQDNGKVLLSSPRAGERHVESVE
jgi:hypothetical protein